jgi:signal transduction histidine kinase
MTDRAAAAMLWSTAAVGAAALLATVSPLVAEWVWLWRFGCLVSVISATSGPMWFICRNLRLSHKPTPNPPLARFLSVAHHEMKTPLAGIKAYVELLADGDADDEVTREEFIDGISSQAERLERTIDELLELVRGRCDAPTANACSTSASTRGIHER